MDFDSVPQDCAAGASKALNKTIAFPEGLRRRASKRQHLFADNHKIFYVWIAGVGYCCALLPVVTFLWLGIARAGSFSALAFRNVAYCCVVRSTPAGSMGCPSRSNRGISPCFLSARWRETSPRSRRERVAGCDEKLQIAVSVVFPQETRTFRGPDPVPMRCRKLRRTLTGRTQPVLAANRPMAAKCHFFWSPPCQYSASG